MKAKLDESSRKFLNSIKISGSVTGKDATVNYIPDPMFGFELTNLSFLGDSDDLYSSVHRAIIFNDEDAINNLNEGDHVLLTGEVQSRNFTNTHDLQDESVINAVDLYMSLLDKIPSKKEPTQFFRQPIEWSLLKDMNLIDEVPNDSAYDENQKFNETEATPYIYKVDWNGEVTKESKDTIYEILVHSYELIDSPEFSDGVSDINEVNYRGRIAVDPFYAIDTTSMKQTLEFTAQAYLDFFKGMKRFAFIPFLLEDELAETGLGELTKNDYVILVGSFISLNTTKEIRFRKVSPSGKVRRRKVEIDYLKRFIVVNDLKKRTNL